MRNDYVKLIKEDKQRAEDLYGLLIIASFNAFVDRKNLAEKVKQEAQEKNKTNSKLGRVAKIIKDGILFPDGH